MRASLIPLLLSLLFGPACLGACARATDAPGEPIGLLSSAVLNGAPDTTHTAVVSLGLPGELCTATIVGVHETEGLALTAAHCCYGSATADIHILMGDQATEGQDLTVTQIAIDRAYDGQSHDFCIVTFTGTSERIAGLPRALLPNGPVELSVGDVLDFVGYGVDAEGNINIRQRAAVPLTGIDELTAHYDQTQGGPCSGDSGGPGFFNVDGVETLAVVVSGGADDCKGEGVSGRVDAVLEDFIEPYLAGQAQRLSCGECAKAAASRVGSCIEARLSCLNDPACGALAQCYSSCLDDSCRALCTAENLGGLSTYNAIEECVCSAACADVCTEDELCAGDINSSRKRDLHGCSIGWLPSGALGIWSMLAVLWPLFLQVRYALRRRRGPFAFVHRCDR